MDHDRNCEQEEITRGLRKRLSLSPREHGLLAAMPLCCCTMRGLGIKDEATLGYAREIAVSYAVGRILEMRQRQHPSGGCLVSQGKMRGQEEVSGEVIEVDFRNRRRLG